MENIHAGVHERHQEAFQLFRILGQLGVVILLLPLGKAQHNGELLTYRFTDRLDDLHAEAGAVLDGATVLVIALVGAFPEELVQQIAVGTMNLYPVKAHRLGSPGGVGKSLHHILDILMGHGVAIFLARLEQAGRRMPGHVLVRTNTRLAHRTHMPELRNNLATGLVDRIHHLLPPRHGGIAINGRHPLIAVGRLVAHKGALGDDQPHLTLGTTAVVTHHLVIGHIARREGAGHGGHGHPVTQVQGFVRKRAQQTVQGTTHCYSPEFCFTLALKRAR